jgi:hypothetical protein
MSALCVQCRVDSAASARLYLDGTRKRFCGGCARVYRELLWGKLCGKHTPKGDCSRASRHSPNLDCRHDPIQDKREREIVTKAEPAMRQLGDLL